MEGLLANRFKGWGSRLTDSAVSTPMAGKIQETRGQVVRAHLPNSSIGDMCDFVVNDEVLAHGEVVGVDKEVAVLAILGDSAGLSVKTLVVPRGQSQTIEVSTGMLGRVIDGMGRPIDGKGDLPRGTPRRIYSSPPSPLERKIIDEPMSVQIRAIDSLLTIGEGQRIGVFAAAGVGKSTLLSQIVKGASAQVRVIALIGERGREVREFVEHSLGPEALAQTIIVCATSDASALERTRAAYMATAIAEHFRDEGQKVLLMMDSVTRFARALREIGLSAGEPPARQGFPPSVFATLPKLLERSGMGAVGSITAIYTVLVEGNDMSEPVADETRSILDGHIVLSRDLASQNHFPAIDVLASTSRVMHMVTTPEHRSTAAHLKALMGAYKKAEVLIKVGEYKTGSDKLVDEAIAKMPTIMQFLCQPTDEFTRYDETLTRLTSL